MVNKIDLFKDIKKPKKEKELKPMKLAKDALYLAGGVAVIGIGLHVLDEVLD